MAEPEPEPPASSLPKGAVNRRRRVSVSAEVDTSKVTKTHWKKKKALSDSRDSFGRYLLTGYFPKMATCKGQRRTTAFNKTRVNRGEVFSLEYRCYSWCCWIFRKRCEYVVDTRVKKVAVSIALCGYPSMPYPALASIQVRQRKRTTRGQTSHLAGIALTCRRLIYEPEVRT